MKFLLLFNLIMIFIISSINLYSQLIWSTYLGGNWDDVASGIKVDSFGNSFITGTTSSTDFPITNGSYQTTFKGASDVFLTKLNSTGNNIIFSTFISLSGIDFASDIAIDKYGNSYITGYSVNNNGYNSDDSGFVTKLNQYGTNLIYSIKFVCDAELWDGNEFKITLDSSGCAYILGYTYSDDIPVTSGAYDTTFYSYGGDLFISKYNQQGSNLIFSTYLGGNAGDKTGEITLDLSGNSYITGNTFSKDFPVTVGAFQAISKINGEISDAFLTKLNSAGSSLFIQHL
jgi:hypothetical protein